MILELRMSTLKPTSLDGGRSTITCESISGCRSSTQALRTKATSTMKNVRHHAESLLGLEQFKNTKRRAECCDTVLHVDAQNCTGPQMRFTDTSRDFRFRIDVQCALHESPSERDIVEVQYGVVKARILYEAWICTRVGTYAFAHWTGQRRV